jgi:hypothetical protein
MRSKAQTIYSLRQLKIPQGHKFKFNLLTFLRHKIRKSQWLLGSGKKDFDIWKDLFVTLKEYLF